MQCTVNPPNFSSYLLIMYTASSVYFEGESALFLFATVALINNSSQLYIRPHRAFKFTVVIPFFVTTLFELQLTDAFCRFRTEKYVYR